MQSRRTILSISLSLLAHGLILFGFHQSTQLDLDQIHYSKNSSDKIQIRRMLNLKKATQMPKEIKKVEAKRAKQVVKQQSVAKKTELENSSVEQVIENSGQQSKKAQYLSQIRDQILAMKRYPRLAKRLKKQGVVDVYFEISYPRQLGNIKIQKGSEHDILNESALETVKALEDIPVMPEFLKTEVLKIAIPIKYELL